MNLRTHIEQFEPSTVKRINVLLEAFDSLGFRGNARYFVFEIKQSLKVGNLLAALSLSASILEFFVRDLLILHTLEEGSSLNGSYESRYRVVRNNIENNERLKFNQIVDRLVQRKVVTFEDSESLVSIYKDYRIPFHHGIVGRIIEENIELPFLLDFGLEPHQAIEDIVETVSLNIIELIVKFIAKYHY